MGVAIGVDTHKATLAAAAVDDVGRELASKEFANDPEGHRRLATWLGRFDEPRTVGIEGSGLFGAALAWFLLDRGENVREVPASLTFRERNRRRSDGKSDPVDALAIARVVAREQHLPIPKRAGLTVDLKLLNTHREHLIGDRTRLANYAHRDLVIMLPGYHKSVPNLRSTKNIRQAIALVEADPSVRARLTTQRLHGIIALDVQLRRLEKQITEMLDESKTSLTQLKGVGSFVAATILGEVGDVSRIRSRSAFASFAGIAPLQASSGKTSRHRFNRGGNRQLHRALHTMAKTQSRVVPEAREFVGRKMEEGKSYKEAIRSLQRHLSNVVFRTMVDDAERLGAMT
jgi:transposase